MQWDDIWDGPCMQFKRVQEQRGDPNPNTSTERTKEHKNMQREEHINGACMLADKTAMNWQDNAVENEHSQSKEWVETG